MKYFLIFFSFVTSLNVLAQDIHTRIAELPVSSEMETPVVVINKDNPKNIVVVASADKVFVTMDGGTTWEASALQSSFGFSEGFSVVSGKKGTLYCLHLSSLSDHNTNFPVAQISDDGGKTWSDGIKFQDAEGQNSSLHIFLDNKNGFIASWTKTDPALTPCATNVMASISDNGKKWETPVVISGIAGGCGDDESEAINGIPAITLDGKAFVSWTRDNAFYFDRSYDAGKAWLRTDLDIMKDHIWQVTVPPYPAFHGTPLFTVNRSLNHYSRMLYVVTTEDDNVWMSGSVNYGDNWSTPKKIQVAPTTLQYSPAVAVDEVTGTIRIAYFDRQEATRVMLASTEDVSNFLSTEVSNVPIQPDPKIIPVEKLGIDAHNNETAVVWINAEEGKRVLYFALLKPEPSDSKKGKKKK